MAKITIELDTGDLAFDSNPEGEMSEVLKQIEQKIQRGGIDQDFKIYDTNGNAIGSFRHEIETPINSNRV